MWFTHDFYIFYTQMKKSIFTLGFLTLWVLCLSACGNKKDFNMSFEDALDTASHSSFQDIITNIDNAEQSFDIAWNYNKNDLKIEAKIASNSKQNLKDVQSESNIDVDFKMQQEENKLNVNWGLNIKFIPSAIYLSLNSLDIKWSESAESMAWIASWYLNQWFSIPLDETIDIKSLDMKEQFEISEKIKEVINNEWFQVYSGKFTDYNWYNAWKISIDDEKLIKILRDSYNYTNNISNNIENEETITNEEIENSNTTSEENVDNTEENTKENTENNDIENFEENIDSEYNNVKIENFEWYLIIIWKDKVALAIENIDITENDTTTNMNGLFSNKDILLSVYSEWEEAINLSAKKSWSHFNTTLTLKDLFSIEWTITPKISSSKINIKFDLSLTIKSDNNDTIIPLKGSWNYSSISEYKVEIPTESQDLSEILWGLLGWLYGGWLDDYSYDNDYYDDYDLDTEDNYNQDYTESDVNNEETTENITISNNEN